MSRCPEVGEWRAYLDNETASADSAALTAHLQTCHACQALVVDLRQVADSARQHLAALMPPVEPVAARQAWRRLQPHLVDRPVPIHWRERIAIMLGRVQAHPARLALTGALASLVVIVALAITPAGSQALQALSVFRVQTFKAITFEVDPATMPDLAAKQHADRHPGSPPVDPAQARQKIERELAAAGITMKTDIVETTVREVPGVDAARAAASGTVYTIAALPAAAQTGMPRVYIADPTTTMVNVDLATFRQAMRDRAANMPAGAAPVDPSALPGISPTATTIAATLRTSFSVVQVHGEDEDALLFAQGDSPEVAFSEEIDILAFRDAMLAMPGISKTTRTQILSIRDDEWTHTLIIPVPRGTIVKDITVGGTLGNLVGGEAGILILSPEGQGGTVLWQQGGTLFAIAGNYSEEVLLRAAHSVR